MAAPVYLTEMCVPVAASTGRQCLHTASLGDLTVPHTRTSKYIRSVHLEQSTIVYLPVDNNETISQITEDVLFLLGLQNMTVCALS